MFKRFALVLAISTASFLAGVFGFMNNVQPIPQMRTLQHWLLSAQYDDFGRLTTHLGKTHIACPVQDARTGVILAVGQSNAGNHGEKYSTLSNSDRIFNYWRGACYDAIPPLLGSSGRGGSFVPLLADRLISNGVYDKVIIVSSAISASNIARWGDGGDLNSMLRGVVSDVVSHYAITDVVWHQGESDFQINTSALEYRNQFASMTGVIGGGPPIFIGIASKCPPTTRWNPMNGIAGAQRELIASGVAFLGADSDDLVSDDMRLPDQCHLKLSGESAVANAYATEIIRRRLQP